MSLEPPIIIVGDGQVEMFGSTARLEASVEAVDTALYRAYDSKGRAVRLSGQYKEGGFLWLRVVSSGEVSAVAEAEQPLQAEELRVALLDWWKRTGGADRQGATEGSGQWGLAELVGAIASRDGVR